MIKEIINTYIDNRVLVKLLLKQEVPHAEGFTLIGLLSPLGKIILRAAVPEIVMHVIAVICDSIAVQHVQVIIHPQRRAPARVLILIGQPDIDLMLRFIEELPRHIRVTFVDCMQISIPQFCRKMFTELPRDFRFKSRNFSPSNIFKAVNHIGRRDPCFLFRIGLRMEVHKFPCKIGGHIVLNPIMEYIDPNLIFSLLRFKTQVKIQRFFRPQIRIAKPVIAQLTDT